MKELTYLRPDDAGAAVSAVAADPHATFLGGGTNLVDHLKLGVVTPSVLVDVSRLPMNDIETDEDLTRVGANVRNSDLAASPIVRRSFPALTRALLAGASGQIRNQATTGGNLLQRTRCVYFQDVTTPCNKRDPGSGCSALEGYGRYNAVLGTSAACVATHPSDMAVAMTALDADVVMLGPDGERRIPIGDLHTLPGHHPDVETTLAHGELITAVELSSSHLTRHSTYYKARDRASYAFALVSVAAALELDEDDTVRDLRIVWGGVAHKPWRATRAEELLRGQTFTEDAVREAAAEELRDAVTTDDNAFKIDMVSNVTALVMKQLAARQGGNA